MPTVRTLNGAVVSMSLETRDFEGYRDSVLVTGGLADTYAPGWTDRSEADLGVALVEANAFFSGNLSYYQDRCANEAMFPLAVQRKSVIAHCKLLGYELRPGVSASVDMSITANSAGSLPKGTQIEVDTSDGSESATFELEEEFAAAGAGTTLGVVALHGSTTSEILGSSNGGPGQKFQLSRSPLSLNPSGSSSLIVAITAGVIITEWIEVDNFLESEPADLHYRTEIDENDVVTIIFGDGVNGAIPASGTDNVGADYRVGGGAAGNAIGANTLTKLVGTFTFIDSVTNPAAPSGGAEKESIEEAKTDAPLSLKAMDRAVTHDDYETQARRVAGVAKAHARQGAGAFEERVVISAEGQNPVPSGSWDPFTEIGTGLLGSVGSFVSTRKTTPVILHVDPVNLLSLALVIEVYIFDGVRRSSVWTKVIEALVGNDDGTIKGTLNVERQDLGKQVPRSMVAHTVEEVDGVDYVDIIQFQRIPWARPLNTGSAFDGTFGSFSTEPGVARDTWTVQFTGSSNFIVSGVSGGSQVNTGTLDITYTTDDGNFSFLVSSGVFAPTAADRFQIVVGPLVGNIDPEYDEICKLKDNQFDMSIHGGVE